jgi:hypothetical protein
MCGHNDIVERGRRSRPEGAKYRWSHALPLDKRQAGDADWAVGDDLSAFFHAERGNAREHLLDGNRNSRLAKRGTKTKPAYRQDASPLLGA